MNYDDVSRKAHFLTAYDAQLRTDSETPSAIDVALLGPLRLVTFAGGRGFITYPHLGDLDRHSLRSVVAEALDYFRDNPDINQIEWKTRGHDRAPGLHEALRENGFRADDPESIMIGEAQALALDLPLPDGVTLRQVHDEAGVRAMSAMQDEVFGDPVSDDMAVALLSRLSRNDGMQLWIAETQGEIVTAGRLEPMSMANPNCP